MRNEAFIPNMTGKTVSFDVQPYERGTGTITKITGREIKTREFCPRRGRIDVTYECFDLEVEVETGSKTGALLSGVPVSGTVKDTAGKLAFITGVGYGQLRDAVVDGKTIVIARCG
jgi:hypothetical protein